jgi:hypothetical protein
VGVAYDLLGGNQDVAIGGTLPQRIGSCLSTLDSLLCQPEAVVSSFVLAETAREANQTVLLAAFHSVRQSLTFSVSNRFYVKSVIFDALQVLKMQRRLARTSLSAIWVLIH